MALMGFSNYKVGLLFVFFIAFNSVTLSQENLSYNIEKITYDNGESIGHTRKIVFDSTGIMWITGRGVGLHSFDGKKIITYHLSNENYYFPLEQSVLIDKKNDETFELSDWHEQIYSFNPYSKKITDSVTFNNPKGIESGMYDFLVDSKSNKWAVTWGFQNNGDSVFVIRGEKGEKLRRIDKIRIETFPKLIEHKNRIYYTSKGSIRAYNQDGTFFKSYDLVDENLIVSPFGLCSDSKGGLWVKSNGKIGDLKKSASIFKLNESKQQFEIFKVLNDKILRDVHYINVIEDKIWLGGVREKLLTIDITTGDIEDYSEVLRGLSSKSLYINKLYCDEYGVIWMTTSQGLFKLSVKQGSKFDILLDKKDGFCEGNCMIQSVISDDEFIYIAYINSLVRINKKTGALDRIPYVNKDYQLGTNRSVIWDDGAKKLSNYKNKLIWHNKIVDKSNSSVKELVPNLPDFRSVNAIINGSKVWIVPYYAKDSLSELFIYDLDSSKFTIHGTKTVKEQSEHPHSILESTIHDKVWVSYFRRGILEFDKRGNFKRKFKPFPSNKIVLFNATLEDRTGKLWAGTTIGLVEINPMDYSYTIHTNSVQSYQGKVNNKEIKSMVFINDSIIWIGGSSGVQRFNIYTKKFNTPDIPLDLKEVESTASAVYFDDSSSKIYLGTKRGLIVFNPYEIEDTSSVKTKFPILISNYSIYNSNSKKTVRYNSIPSGIKKIELLPNDEQIELNFVLPGFPMAKDLLYSYKLEGYDNDWSFPSVTNKLKYNRLPPGEYVLKLRVGPDRDNINRFNKSIKLIVYQIWYKKQWFLFLCFLALIGLIVLILQIRFQQKLNKELELERLRTKISTDLHDDVGSILTGLAMQTEILQRQATTEQKSKLSRVSELSRSAMLRMRDAVWTMDARKDNWKSLIDRMNEFISETLEVKGIGYQFKIDGVELDKKVNTLLRQNLYLIFKECIANVLKHSDATEVVIKLESKNGVIQLEISDNGTPKQKFSEAGLGLTNIKMRTDQIKGNLIVRTDDGFSIKVITNK